MTAFSFKTPDLEQTVGELDELKESLGYNGKVYGEQSPRLRREITIREQLLGLYCSRLHTLYTQSTNRYEEYDEWLGEYVRKGR